MKRELVYYPDSRLRAESEDVVQPDNELVAEMVRVFDEHSALGISAIQLGVPKRIIVVKANGSALVMYNPKIVNRGRAGGARMMEGCLSFPGFFSTVYRSLEVDVEFNPIDSSGGLGAKVVRKFFATEAQAIQHEIDHLNGRLFIDFMTAAEKGRAIGESRKRQKRLGNKPVL